MLLCRVESAFVEATKHLKIQLVAVEVDVGVGGVGRSVIAATSCVARGMWALLCKGVVGV
jgi:hypothetical protein